MGKTKNSERWKTKTKMSCKALAEKIEDGQASIVSWEAGDRVIVQIGSEKKVIELTGEWPGGGPFPRD